MVILPPCVGNVSEHRQDCIHLTWIGSVLFCPGVVTPTGLMWCLYSDLHALVQPI